MSVETTCTLESFIKYKDYDSNIYYSNLSIFEKAIDNSEILLVHNVLNDYQEEILEKSALVKLTDKEFNKYIYKPKLLAYDLYGFCEYYYIILFLNQMTNIKEFNKRKIRLLRPSTLSSILSSIYSSEEDFITTNQDLLNKE
jgi:hypothetical protein